MRAFNTALGWMNAASVPENASVEGESILVGGVSVTIRHAGRVVGRGTSFERACERALAEAMREALRDAAARIPLAADDDMRAAQLRDAALTLELAGPLTPIAPDAIADVGTTLSPGIDGVAARLGQVTEAVFPEQMLLAGMDARGALGTLAGVISGSPADGLRDPGRVRRELGVSFLSFRTAHIAQARPGGSPITLYRGSRVPTTGSMDFAELRRMADGIAAHLVTRGASRERSDTRRLGTPGTYLPVGDRFETESAPASEQALVAIALWAHAQTPGTPVGAAAMSRAAAEQIVSDLIVVEPGEMSAETSPASAAVVSVAIRRIAGSEPDSSKSRELLARCDGAVDAWATAFLTRSHGSAPESREIGGEAGLVAWALSERVAHLRGEQERETERARASRLVRDVYLAVPGARLAAQMPWLAWADAALTPSDGQVPSASALAQLRETAWAFQLKPADVGLDGSDLVGGIVLSSGGAALPTWQSMRVVTLAAWMLGDARLTSPSEVVPEVSRLLGAMEFLRRLAADESTCHMYPSPSRAMWGVRVATWDQRMTPEASAMGLIAVSEVLSSVARIADRSPSSSTANGGENR